MGQLQTVAEEISRQGYQILAIAPDRPEKLVTAKIKNGVGYVLLSDASMEVARAFGIAWELDDDTLAKLAKYGIDLEESSGQTHHQLPVPSVFLIDPEGRISFQYVNPDYKVRLHPQVLLAAAKAAIE